MKWSIKNEEQLEFDGDLQRFQRQRLVHFAVEDEEEFGEPQVRQIGLFLFLLLFCVATVFGNALVILAVVREATLHSVTNYMITSLAVADSIVGLVVMPFSAILIAMDYQWIFGQNW